MIKHGLVAGLAFVSTAAFAQGTFDFSRVPGLSAEPTVQVEVPGAMLRFLANVGRAANPSGADALDGIRGVRVLVYERLDRPARVLETIEDAAQMLESEGWQRMVYVADEGDNVRLHVKFENEQLAGMTLMALERGGEAVFVNIDGTFDPATLGWVAHTIGMHGVLGRHAGPGRIGAVSFPARSRRDAP